VADGSSNAAGVVVVRKDSDISPVARLAASGGPRGTGGNGAGPITVPATADTGIGGCYFCCGVTEELGLIG
jgi:hypothetical protein